MNICFFHSSMQPGGIERTISLLANMYVQNGDEISIITLDDKDSFYSISPDVQQYHLGLSGNSQNAFQAVKRNVRTVAAFRNAIKGIRPDVIVTFGANTELTAYLAKLGLGDIALIGGEYANPYNRGKSFWSRSLRLISCLCDGFLFQTHGVAQYYPKKVNNRSAVIQNCIDASLFAASECQWEQRRNICAVGRMDDDKRFEDVIRTFSIVHEDYPDIGLDLYGDGPKRGELEKLCESLDISHNVVFHGQCNNMPEEYGKHKYFLMMSRTEGLPNVLIEAMVSGCVCVAGNCDFGPSELIRDGENGFLVPVFDCDAAAKKLLYAINNDAIAHNISIYAKELRRLNDIEKIGNETYQYIQRIFSTR